MLKTTTSIFLKAKNKSRRKIKSYHKSKRHRVSDKSRNPLHEIVFSSPLALSKSIRVRTPFPIYRFLYTNICICAYVYLFISLNRVVRISFEHFSYHEFMVHVVLHILLNAMLQCNNLIFRCLFDTLFSIRGFQRLILCFYSIGICLTIENIKGEYLFF